MAREHEEQYAQVQEKDGGERREHHEKDRKHTEDGGKQEEREERYDEAQGEVEQHPVITQAGGGRTYYFTIPIRSLTGHIPDEFLEKLTLYYTLYGLVFAAVGAIAIVLPLVFGVAVDTLLSWLLILGGSVTLLMFLLICGAPGTTAFFLLSALHLTAGIYLMIRPPSTTEHLTYFLAGWFILHGALKIFMSIAVRKIVTWPAVLLSGITAVILAFVIVALTPKRGLQLVAVAFGADLAFTGLALLLISIMGFLGKASRSVSDADLINEPFLQNSGQV